MRTQFLFILLSLAVIAGSCRKEPAGPAQPKPFDLSPKSSEVISGSNAFGIDLFRITALEETDNLMLSPLSAGTALTMLLNGCSAQTFAQIRDMLGYQGLTLAEINDVYMGLVKQLLAADPEVQLALANSVWYRQDFTVKQPFLVSMDNSFEAEIAPLDFSSPGALDNINNWAKENTNGKIVKVLDMIDPDAAMFLMNALYFKGTWTFKFDAGQTAQAPFHLLNGDVVNVEMMKSQVPIKMYPGNGYTAIEMMYGRQNFSMVIVFPVNSLADYLAGFNNEEWAEITAALDAITETSKTEISLPKFKFDYEKKLNEQLKSMGMTDAFDPVHADLSGISDAGLYVDFVKQNTFVDVNEEGTEAAAVTTVGINYTSVPEPVVIDSPFIFAIRERMTNTLLFIGKVENPQYLNN